MRWISVRTVAAAPDQVFRTVADPEEFRKATSPDGAVEYLTPARAGVGTRFRATRINKSKSMTFEQEVTEYVPGQRVRMVNVTHGTEWDSSFSVQSDGPGAILTLTMDARTERLLARIMTRLISGIVQRALDKDMDALKAYCE